MPCLSGELVSVRVLVPLSHNQAPVIDCRVDGCSAPVIDCRVDGWQPLVVMFWTIPSRIFFTIKESLHLTICFYGAVGDALCLQPAEVIFWTSPSHILSTRKRACIEHNVAMWQLEMLRVSNLWEVVNSTDASIYLYWQAVWDKHSCYHKLYSVLLKIRRLKDVSFHLLLILNFLLSARFMAIKMTRL